MQITSKQFPEGLEFTCGNCASQGYTLTFTVGSGEASMSQVLDGGTPTSLICSHDCPVCEQACTRQFDMDSLRLQTDGIPPNLLGQIVKDTLAGVVSLAASD